VRTFAGAAARLSAALAAAVWLACAATPAAAQPTSVTAPVTDEADVLSASEEAEVERTLDQARAGGVDLRVLFVDDTGGTPAPEYAEDVAANSSMAGDDALLVVAFDDRTYALWAADALEVNPSAIGRILDGEVAPPLRDGDVPAAVEAAAGGIADARGGGGGGGISRPGGGFSLLPLLLLGLGAFFLFRMVRSRTRPARGGYEHEAEAPPAVDLEALAAEANAALVRVDDQLQDAEHESGFAEAQFGPEEGAALRQGLEQARAELQRAFTLRQRLDDDVPDHEREQVQMLQQILEHARSAEATVAERLDRLEELRGLERDPTAAAASLRARHSRVAQRLPATEASIAELRATAASAAAAVDGNAVEAEKRLVFADDRLEDAAVAAPADAARALRAAGAAIAQAEQLLDAADDLVERVRLAREELPQELQEAELALARAEDLVRSRRHVVGREARTRVVEARRHYDRARALAVHDPAAATIEADTAETLADEAFELGLRDSDDGGGDFTSGGGGVSGFGWGLPIPIPFPFPIGGGGGGIGWGGTSWGGGFGGTVGGGSFGGGSIGGGKW
jgi:hypothetical protein